MADPSLQTFCCRNVRNVSLSEDFLLDFNSYYYNSLCLLSSTFGIFGALYQIIPRVEFSVHHRWTARTASRGRRIIIWLATADLMASLGVFLRSIMWLYYEEFHFKIRQDVIIILCAIAAAWVQYFYAATWLWTMIYAIDLQLVVKNHPGYPYRYHAVVWSIPAVFTVVGLSILYIPNANCHNFGAFTRVLPNYIANYLPMAAVMIINPVLYMRLTSNVQDAVVSSTGQITNRERKFVDLFKIKFCLINTVFYICWLPNLINGILIWSLWGHLPKNVIVVLWYIMAITNPLQALFNCLVYRRWNGSEQICLPFSSESLRAHENVISAVAASNESTPLIGSSINASSNTDDERNDADHGISLERQYRRSGYQKSQSKYYS